MEPVVFQEVDNSTPFASNPAPSVSGIRALPSRDDSDGESFMLSDSVPPSEVAANEGFSSDSSSIRNPSRDSEKEEEEVGGGKARAFMGAKGGIEEVLVKPIGESFGEPIPEFSTPRAGVPIAKISVDDDDDVEEDEIEGFSIGAGSSPPKVVASRVEGVDADGDEDGFQTAVAGSRNPQGVKFDDLVTETGNVLEGVEEGEGEDDLEDKGVTKESNSEALVGSSELSSVVDEPSLAKPEVGVENGVELISEGDAVVDSINVDPTEVVRRGVAVLGEEVESKDSEGDVVENSAAEEPAIADSEDVEVGHDKPTDVGNLAVDVDVTEALKSQGVDDTEASETKEAEASVDEENSALANVVVDGADNSEAAAGVAGEAEEALDSEARSSDLPALENPDSAIAVIGEGHGAKITNQGDSVVDKINMDVIEAIRSGAVGGGEHEESNGVEAKENGSAVDESINTELESHKHDANTTGAKENGSAVDESSGTELESYKYDTNTTGAAENGSAVDESIGTELESYKHDADTMDAVAGQEHTSGSVDNLSTVNTVAVPEASSEGLKSEVPDRDEEKVQEVQTTGDALTTNDRGLGKLRLSESTEGGEAVRSGVRVETEVDDKPETDDEDLNGSTDGETDGMVFGSSAAARQFMQELERASGADSQVGAGSSHELAHEVDGQIVTDSEEEADSDNEQDGQELFDSAALAALMKAATNASVDPSNLTITSQDGTRLFSVERPAGLGSSLRSVRSSARPNSSSMFVSPGANALSEESLTEEERTKLEKLQQLRVKFLRLVYRLGHSADDSVATQVLYRLALLAGRPSVPSFNLDVAKHTAQDLEEEGKEDLNLSLNILVLGKSGVGKSATINSIFGEDKVKINAFEPGTTAVSEITGVVSGVNVRVFDTPGLRSSALEQGFNRKVLASVKKFTKKSPPDIVLYVDRLDSQTKDLNDLPLLRTITSCLGSSIWRNAIVTLTHAACAPPDGPSGSPLSYEVFVAQRSHSVQQYIGQAVGDFRLMSPGMMNPVSLVENHLACRRNREGQKVLPNGQTWRPQLMLLCFSMKILSEASSVTKASESNDQRKLFGFRVRSPPLPYLLSSLLQPRAHPKLSADQGGDNGDSDIDADDFDDLDVDEEEDEYDQLPPFKPLRKAQISRLSKEQRKAYFEEYDYRVKLLQKKQWKEELKRMRDGKKNKGATDLDDYGQRPEDYDPENEPPAAVPVPLPDMVLPPTFDGDNPAFRYRFLEPTSQFLARPVLDTHGWDHDCGYDGVNVEQNLAVAGHFPAALTVQVTKDKKDFNLHLDSSVSAKHGENGSSLLGFDIQNIGKQLGYIVRGETKFKNLKKNKTAAGVSITFLGESVATGVKVEDQLSLGKRLVLVGSTGTVRSQKDAAYGANLEVRLKDAEYPIGQDQSSFVLSLMKWRGDLALGANLQSQISVGRNSKMVVRVALNNKQSGQITVRTSSSDHLQLALAGLIPIAVSIFRSFRPGMSENYPIY